MSNPTDIYKVITKDNFDIIKDMITEGMLAHIPPHNLALDMAEKTGLTVEQCRMVIMNEYFAYIDEQSDTGVFKKENG